ncbi:MAG: MerR family transcriptional regulator [Rhodothermales bacterium]|nr:MerR family transcriptional regulator [Rhodothermales bacterium]
MSDADPRIRKLYYSISEVSEMTGLDAHVLRYWETEFEALRPRKNRAGHRTYTEADIETVRYLQHLLRDEKYTLDGARQRLARRGTEDEQRHRLLELRAFLVGMRVALSTPVVVAGADESAA